MVTALPQSERYYSPLVAKWRWVPTIADTTGLVPVYAEWDAGIDLSTEVADTQGLDITEEAVPTPGLSGFTGSVRGRRSVPDSSISFYASIDGQDVRTVLSEGQIGNLAKCPAGDEAAKLMTVFPVQLGAFGEPVAVTGSTAHLLVVPVRVLRLPKRDIAIPASA